MPKYISPHRTLFQPSATDEITQIYDKMARDIEQKLRSIVTPMMNAQVVALHNLLEAVLVARNSREIVAALVLLQKAVEGLLEGFTSVDKTTAGGHGSIEKYQMMIMYRDCHLAVLKGLQDPHAYGPQWTNKQVTRWVDGFVSWWYESGVNLVMGPDSCFRDVVVK